MSEALQRFIGKECIISTTDAFSAPEGIVKAVDGNWLTLQRKQGQGEIMLINTDFIIRIREYPKSKSGKRKKVAFG